MRLTKRESDGVGFANKINYEFNGTQYQADIVSGDIIKLLDGGVAEEWNFGLQHNFKIETRNGEKKASFNQKSINVLIDEFGDNTDNWVGKSVSVITKKDVIGGKKCIVDYFVTKGWSLDDYGDLVKGEVGPTQAATTQPVPVQQPVHKVQQTKPVEEEIPTIDLDADAEEEFPL